MRHPLRISAIALSLAAACTSPGLDAAHGEGDERVLPPATDGRSGKAIYDEYFGERLMAMELEWGEAEWLTPEWVAARREPAPSESGSKGLYHSFLDYNPFNFERPGLGEDSFPEPEDGQHNADLIAAGDENQYWRQRDPTEWMPNVLTAYCRGQNGNSCQNPNGDVMADQLWNSATQAQFRPELERALELCPDCIDVFAAFSTRDLHRIFEIRLVRVVDDHLEVSPPPELPPYRVISVDVSGDPIGHSQRESWNYFGTLGGQDLRAMWRGELSGLLNMRYHGSDAVVEGTIPVLMRTSQPAAEQQYYDGRFDAEFSQLAAGAEDGCLVDCYADRCMFEYDLEGWYYWRTAECACGRNSTPPAGSHPVVGRCGGWVNYVEGQWPSTYRARPTSIFADEELLPPPPPLPDEFQTETDTPEEETPEEDTPEEEAPEEEAPEEETPEEDTTEEMEDLCGNGVEDEGEECDTGDDRSDDAPNACRLDCKDPFCGDGVIDAGEACDDGEFGSATCTPQCLVVQVQPDEQDEQDDEDSDDADGEPDEPPAPTTAGCACSSGGGPPGPEAVILALIWLLSTRRRRRRLIARR